MSQLFISYSSKDAEFAHELANTLEKLGAEVWIDQMDIPPAARWENEIRVGLDNSEAMLLLITPNSMASDYVQREWRYLLSQGKPIYPLLIQPADLPRELADFQHIDFSDATTCTSTFDTLCKELLAKGFITQAPVYEHQHLCEILKEMPVGSSTKPRKRKGFMEWIIEHPERATITAAVISAIATLIAAVVSGIIPLLADGEDENESKGTDITNTITINNTNNVDNGSNDSTDRTATPTLTPTEPSSPVTDSAIPTSTPPATNPAALTIDLGYDRDGFDLSFNAGAQQIDLTPLNFRWQDRSGNPHRLNLSDIERIAGEIGSYSTNRCIHLYYGRRRDTYLLTDCLPATTRVAAVNDSTERFWMIDEVADQFDVYFGEQLLGSCPVAGGEGEQVCPIRLEATP